MPLCIAIGNWAQANFDEATAIGDSAVANWVGDFVVGRTLFGELIPYTVRQFLINNQDTVREELYALVRGQIRMSQQPEIRWVWDCVCRMVLLSR